MEELVEVYWGGIIEVFNLCGVDFDFIEILYGVKVDGLIDCVNEYRCNCSVWGSFVFWIDLNVYVYGYVNVCDVL